MFFYSSVAAQKATAAVEFRGNFGAMVKQHEPFFEDVWGVCMWIGVWFGSVEFVFEKRNM